MVPLTSLTRSFGLVAEGCGAEYAAGSGTAPGSPGSIVNPAVFRLSVGKWLKFGEWFEIVLPRQWLKIECFGGGFRGRQWYSDKPIVSYEVTWILFQSLRYVSHIHGISFIKFTLNKCEMWSSNHSRSLIEYYAVNVDPTAHVKLLIQTGLSDFAWVEENSPI